VVVAALSVTGVVIWLKKRKARVGVASAASGGLIYEAHTCGVILRTSSRSAIVRALQKENLI
jgi:hypothetical protein